MTGWPAPLTCSGRPVDDNLRPVGEPCGTVFDPDRTGGGWFLAGVTTAADFDALPASRCPTDVEQADQARSVGWSVQRLPDGQWVAMCPKCRRPNPQLAATVRQISGFLIDGWPDGPAINPTKE